MGYAFSALLTSQGNIGSVEQTLFVRGLTAPAGHTAWTGLTAGALWAMIASPTGKRVLEFIGTFLGAVILHTLWDTFTGIPTFIVLGIISLGWLFWALHRYKAFGDRTLSLEPLHA
jgi:protease PrsW